MERTVLADGTVRLSSGTHVTAYRRLAPGAFFLRVEGSEVAETRAALRAELEREIATTGSLAIYVDMRAAGRVDAGGRDEWGEFGKAHRAQVQRVVMLVSSRLIEMAMSVLGMFVGGGLVRTMSSETEFEREVARHHPGFVLPRAPDASAGSRR